MCVVITYLAVFSQAWIDADRIFMFSFRRKLLILEKKRKVLFHSFIIYWSILKIHWNPTMCQAVRNQRLGKNYHPFFSDLWKQQSICTTRGWNVMREEHGLPIQRALRKYIPEQKYTHFYEKIGVFLWGKWATPLVDSQS